jgi:hypothetical protein
MAPPHPFPYIPHQKQKIWVRTERDVGAESSWRLRRALQKVIYAMIFEERRAEPMAQQKSIKELTGKKTTNEGR